LYIALGDFDPANKDHLADIEVNNNLKAGFPLSMYLYSSRYRLMCTSELAAEALLQSQVTA